MRTRALTALSTFVLSLVALAAALTLPLPAASAHSVLVGTDPQDGAILATAPAAVTFTFNEDIKGQFNKILVTGPDGTQVQPTVTTAGPKVTAALPEGLGDGAYRVVYSVVSADTHRIAGQIRFTVGSGSTAGATSAGTPSTPSDSPAATTSEDGSGGTSPAASSSEGTSQGGGVPSWVLWLVGGAVLVGGGLWAAARGPRR